MAVLISAHEIAKTFGIQTLFKDLTFSIESGQKIGLIGPNGAGKSTLLQILAKLQTPDAGKISFSNSLNLGYLAQSPRFQPQDTVFGTILEATPDVYDPDNLNLTNELISKLELDSSEAGRDRIVQQLSGGWQKRVALARELVKKPNLLLLDEPTNHLDLPSILWLEDFIEQQTSLAVMMITHDRLFLQKTCDMIFDLDRRNPEGLIKFKGDYSEFMQFKNAKLLAQQQQEASLRNVLERETEWLRRGAKARQTKQKARIERAGELSNEVQEMKARNLNKKLDVDFGEVERSPKKMLEAKDISKRIGDRWLFRDFSFLLTPKTRVGLLGKNGCGKSTLIRTLLQNEKPDAGTVFLADQVRVAYFEQQKQSLNPDISLLRTICPDGDYVQMQGKPVFARSYLSRFHFRSDQMDLPVGKLSGGEQSRILIAKLMLENANVLVLDEPTNDLDIASLDVLQEALAEFPGAVILVTHDRYFMDHVVNQIFAFTEEAGEILRFADFFQWEQWHIENKRERAKAERAEKKNKTDKNRPKGRLSYNEQRELEQMEAVILEAEELLIQLEDQVANPEIQKDYPRLQTITEDLESQRQRVETLYNRWQELNDKLSTSSAE